MLLPLLLASLSAEGLPFQSLHGCRRHPQNHRLVESEWQREGGTHRQQNLPADSGACDHVDQSVWPGLHPYPQAFPHRQAQHPGTVSSFHQPTSFYRPSHTVYRPSLTHTHTHTHTGAIYCSLHFYRNLLDVFSDGNVYLIWMSVFGQHIE